MLNLMREKAGTWLIKVILGAIIIVFIFWGVGSYREQRENKVALVNGEPISFEEYRAAYNHLVESMRQRFGNNLNDNMLKVLRLESQAMDQVIDRRLLLAEASRLRFCVSDMELVDAIRKIEAFQNAAGFDNRLYQKVLRHNNLTPEEFEMDHRKSMLIEKLRSFITGGVKVSDQEARAWHNWSDASVNIDSVLFEPDGYEDIKPSADEIKNFFDKHKESYQTEPMIKVQYLYFDPDTYKPKIQIADEEIQYYYEANQTEFETPKTVEARHILIKLDKEAGPETVEERREEAVEILKMVRDGEDFAELARKYSEGPTKEKGGYLGKFKREAMVKPFADKAFSMKAGETSEPVRTQFGWHLIKVEKVNPQSVLPLNKAKIEIHKKLVAEKANNLAYDAAEAIYDASLEENDLAQIAKKRNLAIRTTDFFTKNGPDIEIMDRAKFASAAFALSAMEISDILDFGDGHVILQALDNVPAKIPELENVKEKVRDDVFKNKQDEKAKKDADTFLSDLKNGHTMSEISKKFNLKPISTGLFQRNDSIPNIGYEREINETAFKLSTDKKIPEAVIKGKKGYYVIKLKERVDPDPEGFNEEKTSIKERLIRQKKFMIFDALLAQLRSTSNISIEDNFKE